MDEPRELLPDGDAPERLDDPAEPAAIDPPAETEAADDPGLGAGAATIDPPADTDVASDLGLGAEPAAGDRESPVAEVPAAAKGHAAVVEERAATAEGRAASAASATGSPASATDRPTDAMRTEARLARLHLRLSMHAIARAELETLAAHGSLDEASLRDLAEVRWRTGDLLGAGEAADACIEAGGGELVVLCIAAEAAAAAGRMAAARHLAAQALARGRDRLDEVFAGQPRSAIWPEIDNAPPATTVPPVRASGRQPAGGPAGAGPIRVTPPAVRPTPAAKASADLADAQARVANGDMSDVAARLLLVLRAQPVLAPAVLAVADEALRVPDVGPEAASLHLVRGDAYRLLGRETLAAEAFQQSSRALRNARPPEETS